MSTHSVDNLLLETPSNRALYEPLTRSFASVRDARAEGGRNAVSTGEINLFLQHHVRRRQRPAGPWLDAAPPPGGMGAGVTFADSLQHFRSYTAVYFYLVAPPSIGLQANAELLYMTSSNAASKGCEALLSFFTNEQDRCAFRIWDWAHPDVGGGSHFVKNYVYDEIRPYLIPYEFRLDNGSKLESVCIYIANITRQTGPMAYQNEVYLQNHTTGTRDLMWSYPFDWPDKATSELFWWGPIFETFPDPGAVYALSTPLGFDRTVLVQDGVSYTLTDQNSSLSLPPATDGLQEIYRSVATNGGLVCSSPR